MRGGGTITGTYNFCLDRCTIPEEDFVAKRHQLNSVKKQKRRGEIL
jgi:hypothetical protein